MNFKKICEITILIIICIFIIFILTGCSKKDNKINDKVNEELNYVSNKIISLLNKINNISFSSYTLKVESDDEKNTNSQSSSESGSSSGSSEENSGSSGKSSSSGNSSNSSSNEKTSKYELTPGGILTNKENTIDWTYIKSEVENLNSIWPTIVIDLHSINIDNNDILNFGNTLDNLTTASKNEDKKKALNLLSNLYSFLPKYRKQYNDDSKKINVSYTISNIINSYVLVEDNKWDEMKTQLNSGKDYFSNIINSIQNNGEEQSKFNKVYVLLNELDNSVNLKDKELYYIKYKNLMENILRL